MSKTESIKWVVCPNGIDSTGQNLQVGVFAGVTLSGGPTGTLNDFADFQNWPETLLTTTGLEFVFSFDGGATVATYAATINPATTQLSEQLWTNLFPTSEPARFLHRQPVRQPSHHPGPHARAGLDGLQRHPSDAGRAERR